MRRIRCAAERAGQVTVELLLVLPVFMLLLFFIMELGNLAYQTILVHHCAYELARIGSLVAGPPGGSSSTTSNAAKAQAKMQSALAKMFANTGRIQLVVTSEVTGVDPQPKASPNPHTHTNEDLLVTLVYPAKLVFPGSSYFFADPPKARGIKNITVRVRMPIEKPMFQ
ncbi:MAG: TadE/TadG family type IV pilus assembly protein [Elusimicrobiales bacterium]|jgi:Flp pilus assembly protein TadG